MGRESYVSNEGRFALVSPDPDKWAGPPSEDSQPTRKAHLKVACGRRPVTITEAGVEFGDGSHAAFKPGTTRNLTEGEFLSFRVSEEALAEAIKWKGIPRKMYAIDGSGRTYRRGVDAKLRPWFDELSRTEVTQ